MLEPEQARLVLVLLHGRSHDPRSMLALHRALGLEEVACVAPAAPGGSWYPDRFFAARAANEPHLSRALARTDGLLDELAARGVGSERVVLGGFSQGACVAADVGARRPRPFAALAVLCGGLIGEPAELARPGPGELAGVPALLTATEQDAWVPVERVRGTAEALGAAGADVDLRVYPAGDHGIRDDEVEALRRLVAGLAR